MEGRSRYAAAVLALLAAFVLFCGTWYLARSSAPEPYQVTAARRPPAGSAADLEGSEDTSLPEEVPWPDSLLPGETIDINSADVYDLQRLPGIGEKRARDIIAYREEHGPFRTADELDSVPGIGPGILEGLREYVTVG